nr:hypothetical protein [Tanacetum cinerariifolium]
MSDASSAVTYMSVYTDSEPWRYYEEDSAETGSPRVIVYRYDGLPIQPVAPPSPDYIPGPEHPPSPDYVPGPKHPPSPIEIPYVPEPEYPEYLAPFDDEEPLEDQPLPADASPIVVFPDYPFDGDDDDDTDDEDPKEEPFEEGDEEEEEHPAPANSSNVPMTRLRRARKTVRPEPPISASMEACIARHAALPLPPLLKRACLTTPAPGFEIRESYAGVAARQPGPTEYYLRRCRIAPTTLEGVNERVTELDTTVRQRTDEFEIRFKDAQDDRALLKHVLMIKS